jgi:hypothetical protein
MIVPGGKKPSSKTPKPISPNNRFKTPGVGWGATQLLRMYATRHEKRIESVHTDVRAARIADHENPFAREEAPAHCRDQGHGWLEDGCVGHPPAHFREAPEHLRFSPSCLPRLDWRKAATIFCRAWREVGDAADRLPAVILGPAGGYRKMRILHPGELHL